MTASRTDHGFASRCRQIRRLPIASPGSLCVIDLRQRSGSELHPAASPKTLASTFDIPSKSNSFSEPMAAARTDSGLAQTRSWQTRPDQSKQTRASDQVTPHADQSIRPKSGPRCPWTPSRPAGVRCGHASGRNQSMLETVLVDFATLLILVAGRWSPSPFAKADSILTISLRNRSSPAEWLWPSPAALPKS